MSSTSKDAFLFLLIDGVWACMRFKYLKLKVKNKGCRSNPRIVRHLRHLCQISAFSRAYEGKRRKRFSRKLIIGRIRSNPKNRKIRISIKPFCSRKPKIRAAVSVRGRIAGNSFEPSSGGIGTRLKTARRMFMSTMVAKL